ncbi:MAG TPA: SDR family NAD(P)-dependent oxidoreductase [Burkholderiaceae bacterium]|jgi:NAD(P)-dependent dehydrogenase (short-subunit alcohol dehydrogenase family)|nr:SDR family NAD(P)-dependent oxidoreductase [Burkholderiaceae bacterium]
MELYVLTGASRGLGRALAERLLAPGRLLLTISRRPDHALEASAAMKGAKLEQWALDLAHDIGAAARLEAWLHGQPRDRFTSATLINNAGLLGRVGPIDASDADTLAAVLRVGLEAPLVMTSAFLRATRAWTAQRRVLNISSGAGRRPIAGWAAYCAAKAGLDHFARVVALDEQRQPNPARICSLAPGVIDTDMQGELRAADPAGFPDIEQFKQLKASGQLAAPDTAAARVLAYLARADFGANPVADVRDA